MFKHFQCFFTSNFTRTPHLAGTVQNFELAKQIHAQWKEFGLDSVELSHYDVLLSYPNKTQPNYISIIDEDGNEVKKIQETLHVNLVSSLHIYQVHYYWHLWFAFKNLLINVSSFLRVFECSVIWERFFLNECFIIVTFYFLVLYTNFKCNIWLRFWPAKQTFMP